jgi:hypothetical protein
MVQTPALTGENMQRIKGQLSVGDIGPAAMSVGAAIILVAVVSMILTNFTSSTYLATPAGVIWDGTAGNTTLTVQGGLVSYTVYNDSAAALVLTEGANYSVNGATGLLYVYSGQTSTNMCNYTYDAYTDATSVVSSGMSANKLFADWFSIIVIVVVSVIIIGIVMLLRTAGGGSA